MDIFLDTGIFIGFCDPKDKHYDDCRRLFTDYPVGSNGYYTCKRVKSELKGKRRARRKSGELSDRVYNQMEQCMILQLRKMSGTVNYEETNLVDYREYFNAIFPIVIYDSGDA